MPISTLSGQCHETITEKAQEAKRSLLPLGVPFTLHAEHIDKLLKRLSEEKLHLAIVGQFKRGKSSLINALLGAEILPTSSISVTVLPTFIRWAPFVRRALREIPKQAIQSATAIRQDKQHSIEAEIVRLEQCASILTGKIEKCSGNDK